MNDIIQKLPLHPFDYLLLMDVLKSYSFPRNKINSLIKKGIIIRIKKGLYILSPDFGGTIDHYILANLIYGPSYISLDFALSYWGLIPESVETVTSVSNKRNKAFQTTVGNFTYKYINDSIFHKGIIISESKSGSFLIASKEKALCDRVSVLKGIGRNDVGQCLRDDLRIDFDELNNLNVGLLSDIARVYSSKTVGIFYKWYLENYSGDM